MVALCALLLVGCGSAGGDDIAWHPVREAVSTVVATPAPPTATDAPAVAQEFTHQLSAAELQKYQPDELGLVPVPMYHAFVKDDESKDTGGGGDSLDEWTRTLSEFRSDLQWYYDHDFYVVPMRDYVENDMKVPAGKHPMVLTFDDASTRQAMWIKNKKGQIVADPDSALGVMEDFYAKHPDFGRGGYFAVLIFNCFNNPDGPPEMADCATKLNWLIDHGYEVGNHTWGHQDLTDITDDEFLYQVGKPILWFRQNIEDKGDMSEVLTLPYGAYPDRAETQQWDYLVNGFDYHGERVDLEGILQVNGGPALSPSSDKFDRYGIARFNTDPDVMAYWWKRIEDGELTMYTSDGNPN
ncbi:MAG TPA: polysaccharide deacetylase family protein, partial [Thermomicrobiales bacterium]|nr:polysaccharide deacetylase family protein [Thermomicrobiales bacterium]